MNPFVNTEARYHRGQEIESIIYQINNSDWPEESWLLLESIADEISDDQYDDIAELIATQEAA